MDADDGQRSFRITNKKTCDTWEREEPGPGEHIRPEEVQTFMKAFSIFSLLCTLAPKFYIISYNYQNHFSFSMSISFIGNPRYLSHKFQECIVICNTHCLATTTSEGKLHILKI
jgi:hypothetical protein